MRVGPYVPSRFALLLAQAIMLVALFGVLAVVVVIVTL